MVSVKRVHFIGFELTALAILCFFMVILFLPNAAFSQTYSRLSPNSDLYCVYLPNGKTKIAVGTKNRFKLMGFKNAQRRTAKEMSAERRKAKKITQLIKKLEKQRKNGGVTATLKPKEVRAVQKFYLEGDLGAEVPPGISENIQRLEGLRSVYYNNIKFKRVLDDLIRQCKKREVPSPGTFPTMFINVMTSKWNEEKDLSGSGYVIVAAIVPAFIAQQKSYLCYDHPTQGTRYKGATTDPCLAEGIKNFLTDDCAKIVERDAKGKPQFYLAALDKRNFNYKNRPGAASFTEAAAAAETSLRTGAFYGWGDSVRYAAVDSVDACRQDAFLN